MTDYNSLKVPDLKALLGQRKLLQTGNKQALITRLQEDDEKNAAPAASKEEAKPGASTESHRDISCRNLARAAMCAIESIHR